MKDNKMGKNIKKQIEDNPVQQDEYGKIKEETIREAVEHLFKTEPREKAQKGEGSYIDVIQNNKSLSFSIKGDEKMISLTTGVGGFLNIMNIENSWALRTLPIKFNGVVLDDKQTEQFWEQIEKLRYESKRKGKTAS